MNAIWNKFSITLTLKIIETKRASPPPSGAWLLRRIVFTEENPSKLVNKFTHGIGGVA